MAEITVGIIWENKQRGAKYESRVNIQSDGGLLIGGVIVPSENQLSEEEIVQRAIDEIYIPMISDIAGSEE